MSEQTTDSRAVISLVLGVLGIVSCNLFGPIAAYLGYAARKDAELEGRPVDGMATAGLILGIVSSVLMLVQLVVIGGICLLYGGIGVFVIAAESAGL